MNGKTVRVAIGFVSAAIFVTTASLAGDHLKKGKTITISTAGATAGDGPSAKATTSSNGRFVAFASAATNLTDPAGNGFSQVMVKDRKTGEIALLSRSGGAEASSHCDSVRISGNGRFVAFRTKAANFPGANGKFQVYRADRKTGAIELCSQDGNGSSSGADCAFAAIDLDGSGRRVAFITAANLIGGFANGSAQVYRRDMKSEVTELVSESALGGLTAEDCFEVAISGNGRHVAFSTGANDIVPDTNAAEDVFVRDMKRAKTRRVSNAPNGDEATGASSNPDLSASGRFVAFRSNATNLTADSANGVTNAFVIDSKGGKRRRFAVDLGGEIGHAQSVHLSDDGRSVAIGVVEQNLIPDMFDDEFHVFVGRFGSGAVAQANLDSAGSERTSSSPSSPAISGDGRFLAFDSSNASLGSDADAKLDVFLRRLK